MTELQKAAQMALEALRQYTDVVTSENEPNSWVKVVDGGKPARDAIEALRAALAQSEQEPCDGNFPEGFNESYGIPAQALRAANAIMFDVIGERNWDVPCTAKHLLAFASNYTALPQSKTKQEPVAWRHWLQVDGEQFPQLTLVPRTDKDDPLYTAPPQREWQGLTDEEYESMAEKYVTNYFFDTLKYARAIETKLKVKNGNF